MKILGIIIEYNPFHNGHQFHLQESLKTTNADGVVGIMSGNFVQRGEPALMDKWIRAEIGVRCGVDLILELPCLPSIGDAGKFAGGAVRCLNLLNGIDYLCFGSESGSIELMQEIACLMESVETSYHDNLKKGMKKGLTPLNASKKALMESGFSEEQLNKLFESNQILGVEYLRALIRYKSEIQPFTIKRKGSLYNESVLDNKIFPSATAIRKHLFSQGEISDLENFVPLPTLNSLSKYQDEKRFCTLENLFPAIQILGNQRRRLNETSGVTEGFANRLRKQIQNGNSQNMDSLISSLKTKEITWTRIQRVLLNLILDIRDEDYNNWDKNGPGYLRVLGFNSKGQKILRNLSESSEIPLITKPSQISKKIKTYNNSEECVRKINREAGLSQFYLEERVSRLYYNFSNQRENLEITRIPYREIY